MADLVGLSLVRAKRFGQLDRVTGKELAGTAGSPTHASFVSLTAQAESGTDGVLALSNEFYKRVSTPLWHRNLVERQWCRRSSLSSYLTEL